MPAARLIGLPASMFDGRLDVLPPLTDPQLAQVPARRGVFLLADESDRPILLTTAASIRARLRGRLEAPDADRRKRTADLREVTRRIYWKLAGSHFETDWQYLELARAIWPKGYTRMLSWKPAWFVHVDPAEPFPHFVRTREVLAAAGRYVGPFETARSADRFLEVLADGFDLCRDVQCLRRSPRGHRCAYGQMGRCLAPCDGTVSMDAYRRVVAGAAEFAAGRRLDHAGRLRERMRAAAAELAFERAAALKARLDRLSELDADACRHVAPAEEFRFLLLQRSGSRRKVSPFCVCRGTIEAGKALDWPLAGKQLRAVLRRMDRLASAPPGEADPAGPWRMGLVARLLFGSPDRAGVVLPWRGGLAPEAVAGAVEAAADALGLSRPAPPADGPN